MSADDDSLRNLLRRKIREASEEAVTSDGRTSPDKVAELERLATLIDIRDGTAATPPKARWPVAAIVGVTVLLVSLLLFLRVPETEVELDVTASEVGFVLSQPQVLTDLANLESVRVSGVRNLQLPEPARSQLIKTSLSSDGAPIRVSTSKLGDRLGTVTLAPLALPAGVEVHVYSTAAPGHRRIAINGVTAPVRMTVNGPIRLDLTTPDAGDVEFPTPKSIVLETDEAGTILEMAAAPGAVAEFSPQISAERLTFFQIDEFQTPVGTTAQTISTVLSGTLYLESLNGAPHQLRPRELVRFDDIRGVVRTLKVEDGHITINFRGKTRGIRSGWGDRPSNLMPTYLTWLQAHHGLSLLWGTTIYAFGIVATILRWWRLPV